MWKIPLILSFALSFTVPLTNQSSATQQTEWGQAKEPKQRWYTDMAFQISKENPSTSIDTLQNDKVAIGAAYTCVKSFYSDKKYGQSDAEVLSIVGRAWSDFRAEHPTAVLTADGFVKYADEYGGLRIGSAPSGAVIQVDGRLWTDETDAVDAVHAGLRTITLSKEGYQEETGTAVVRLGQWTNFFRKLKEK